MSSWTAAADEIASRTRTGIDAEASDEFVPACMYEGRFAEALIDLARCRSQQVDVDQAVALLDAIRDGSTPLIQGGAGATA